MDKFPLMQGCFSVGELITEQEALYTWFEARCRLPGEGLWCAWAVGDRGELRLGVLEPCGDRATIRRRVSVPHGFGSSCTLCRASLSGRSRGGESWRCPMTWAAPFR